MLFSIPEKGGLGGPPLFFHWGAKIDAVYNRALLRPSRRDIPINNA